MNSVPEKSADLRSDAPVRQGRALAFLSGQKARPFFMCAAPPSKAPRARWNDGY
jgi:hypothetical protein